MTEEEKVSYFLRDWYDQRRQFIIHSWHPPSGKTYEGALVRIPKLVDGLRTRDRYHVDFILQVGSVLVLQELKGSAQETELDVAKLREIVLCYSIQDLISVLERRSFAREALHDVKSIVPSIAHAAPAPSYYEPDFLRVVTDDPTCSIHIGSEVDPVSRATLQEGFAS